jgi:hypothetical protein
MGNRQEEAQWNGSQASAPGAEEGAGSCRVKDKKTRMRYALLISRITRIK